MSTENWSLIKIGGRREARPQLKAFLEISVGTPVVLAPGAKLACMHYGLCRTVTVAGGTLTFGTADYTLLGDAVSETRTPCPDLLFVFKDTRLPPARQPIIVRSEVTPALSEAVTLVRLD